MVRKNESSNQRGEESRGQLGQGRKFIQDLGLPFEEVKLFQAGSTLQSVTRHSSVHCLETMGFALLQDAARIFHETSLSLFHQK